MGIGQGRVWSVPYAEVYSLSLYLKRSVSGIGTCSDNSCLCCIRYFYVLVLVFFFCMCYLTCLDRRLLCLLPQWNDDGSAWCSTALDFSFLRTAFAIRYALRSERVASSGSIGVLLIGCAS